MMNLPPDSRVWIFQSKREFSKEEEDFINEAFQRFLQNWESHGASLTYDYRVYYDRFIVVGIDESIVKAGGCAIDELNRFVRELDAKLQLGLLDRTLISYEIEGDVFQEKISTFKEKIKNGSIPEKAIVFNNGVATLEDLKHKWKQTLAQSWAANLIPA